LLGCEQKFWDRLGRRDFKEYIKDPKAKIPGTKMVFPGIKDEKEAEDLWGGHHSVQTA
jgi:cytochrome c2